MRILLALLISSGVGCSCSTASGAPDAAVLEPGDATTDSVFVLDAPPRDASLPCDGTVALLRVDVGTTPNAYQRIGVRAAPLGGGAALAWRNVDRLSEGPSLLATIADLDRPRLELSGPLPLPDIVGIYASESDRGRVLFADDEAVSGLAHGGWAELSPEGSFGALHRFDVPLDGLRWVGAGVACVGGESVALDLCRSDDALGATIVDPNESGAAVRENGFDPVLCRCCSRHARSRASRRRLRAASAPGHRAASRGARALADISRARGAPIGLPTRPYSPRNGRSIGIATRSPRSRW